MARDTRPREIVGLAVSLAIVALVAAAGSFFTNASVDTWYAGLEKPAWTPPGALIGAVWSVLYLLMGIAAWLVWRAPASRERRVALVVYVVQLGLNLLWSALFFGLRAPAAALVEIGLLALAVTATIAAFWRVRPLAGALLVPYLAWVVFAATLNALIWRLNAA